MEDYLRRYPSFTQTVVYDFRVRWGGIGDYLKYFSLCLHSCILSGKRFYCKANNIAIQKLIRLKHETMLINDEELEKLRSDGHDVKILTPHSCWKINDDSVYSTINKLFKIADIFYFDEKVVSNVRNVIHNLPASYIGVHLRLGDDYLETDREFVDCKHDSRPFSVEKLHVTMENLRDSRVVFFCDNQEFKSNLKETYKHIATTHASIGHTSLVNTTDQQILDAVTEFYILSKAKEIYAASDSGFSIMAAKFDCTKYTRI